MPVARLFLLWTPVDAGWMAFCLPAIAETSEGEIDLGGTF